MFCVNCFHPTTAVSNSRPKKKQPIVWRRRRCPQCQTTFTTYERPSLSDNKPIHRADGTTDVFNLGKLVVSISRAFTHTPTEAGKNSLWLAQTVEDILSTQYKVISTEDIEVVTHQMLKRFDELAAVQYAAQHRLIFSTKKRGRPSLRERGQRRDESPSR